MSVLGWQQIRTNAVQFAERHKGDSYEKGETQTFYNEFFEVFGVRRRNVAMYERQVKKLGSNAQGFIDLFWPSMLIVEHKSAGRDLTKAAIQADDYILALKEFERPRYRLVCDFQNFVLTDLETRSDHSFKLEDLPDNIKLFDFIAGRPQKIYKDQDAVNIDASDKMSNLHKVLEASGYKGADLERLLVRIMFCLFADDTGIFEQDLFLNYIRDRTTDDGTDVGNKLVQLFEVLDTPINERQTTLDEDLQAFPYVNGSLFSDLIRTPSFNKDMREALLDCCYFNWTRVSPALFGSLFQTVMLPEEQRKEGAHYTSERNILKTIQPLFLDELRDEFTRLKDMRGTQRKSKLEEFHKKLSTLTFFDPACGCGNFLILAYRELRVLELEILDELYPKDKNGERQGILDVGYLSKIDVDQFYGIEINEFPVRIAETAMWLMDHQMNMRLGDMFGKAYARLPLKKSAHIHHGNALEVDWKDVIAPSKCSYILGNPPFIGAKNTSKEQRAEVQAIAPKLKRIGNLDYVCGWYLIAADYIDGTDCKVALVSTNSISQGEQVVTLWKHLIEKKGIKIHFAHRTFKWTIDEQKAKGMKIASVFVIIVGFAQTEPENRYIYEYETLTSDPHVLSASIISPYLVDRPIAFIENRTKPLCNVPDFHFGAQPIDGGYLTLDQAEYDDFIVKEPHNTHFIKPYLGAKEYINDIPRYVFWLKDIEVNEIKSSPFTLDRINKVRDFRLGRIPEKKNEDNDEQAKEGAKAKFANIPSLFASERQPASGNYLVFPRMSSERREYVPIGFLDTATIASEQLMVLPNATLYHFGVIGSQMHMDWMRYTCGRLKSDYRYSNTVVYNNFPWPEPNDTQRKAIEEKAQAVLDARANHTDSTLADLYDPRFMPADLRKAHNDLDKAVDKAYRPKAFDTELERIQFLFDRYQTLTAPLAKAMEEKPTRRKRNKVGK